MKQTQKRKEKRALEAREVLRANIHSHRGRMFRGTHVEDFNSFGLRVVRSHGAGRRSERRWPPQPNPEEIAFVQEAAQVAARAFGFGSFNIEESAGRSVPRRKKERAEEGDKQEEATIVINGSSTETSARTTPFD